MPLNVARAEAAIREKIARPLGLETLQAAVGIYEIINGHMSDLIRRQVIRAGRLPHEFVLYSFGGAGPVHAAAYGAELGIRRLYLFPTSPVFSSFGIAAADIIHTATRSYRYPMPVEPEALNRKLAEMEADLSAAMEREGIQRAGVRFRRTFYMRYRRQLNELEVAVPVQRYTLQDIRQIVEAFERKYEEVYGEGSAMIETPFTTLVIPPGKRGSMDAYRNVEVEL